ncbi:Adaptor for signal transduction [Trapelia coarctata]|nr:Adaptor for signal transduction [Trapelia coarctata]
MAFPTAYHADSDADDEYERSIMTSPLMPTDDDTSPTDSEPPSTEHTPTTFENPEGDRLSPRTIMTEWRVDDCASFISSLGLQQYCEIFIDNDIVGEALVALRHDELKEMGITSMGHRLTILKGVYDMKVQQDIPVETDHYIPLSADASTHDKTATQDDISRIIQSIKMRDERILQQEAELRRLEGEHRRLREELLPIFRMAKERSQPLPMGPSSASPEYHSHDGMASPVSAQPPPEKPQSTLARKFSKKGLWLNSTPKTSNSPTHMSHSIPEGKSMTDNSNLDPSAAAIAASSHLTASMSGGSQPSNSPSQANMPSPTSPNTYHNQPTIASRGYTRDGTRDGSAPSTGRTQHSYGEELPHLSYNSTASTINGDRGFERNNPTPGPGPGRTRGNTRDQDDSPSSGGREAPSVEIFKSFRVSMEDPCYKVLPAALKKYNINADWRQYALYIVFGDQERCLGLEEKPLILFKQLDKEGRKPMFMLRRHAAPVEGHSGPSGVGAVSGMGFDGAGSLGGGRGHQSSIQLPGGVL